MILSGLFCVFINMELIEKQELIAYLHHFITEDRHRRIEEIASLRTRHFCIVVENLYQSHNTSAILRTAECLGVQDVYLIENNFQYEISPQVSLGSQKWLSIHQYNQQETNTIPCLAAVKKQGYRIVAALPSEKDCLLDDIAIDQRTAFLFGTELDGLTPAAIAMADAFVKIPMYGFTESYNVSVSVALTMMHVCGRLRKSDIPWQLTKEERTDLELQWIKKSLKDADGIVERFYS